jgi:hypothetical protein
VLKPFPPTGPHLTYACRPTYNNISHYIPFSWAEGPSPFLSSCLVSYSQSYSTCSVSSFFCSFRRSSFLFFFLLSFLHLFILFLSLFSYSCFSLSYYLFIFLPYLLLLLLLPISFLFSFSSFPPSKDFPSSLFLSFLFYSFFPFFHYSNPF